jgi:hypothetical protein
MRLKRKEKFWPEKTTFIMLNERLVYYRSFATSLKLPTFGKNRIIHILAAF